MSYSAGEALILTLVKAIPAFSDGNAARQNWRILNLGGDHFAILRPGAFTNDYQGLGRGSVIRMWRTVIEVHQRWDNTTQDTTALQATVQAVIEQIEKYPHLGSPSTVLIAEPSSGGEMLEKEYAEGGVVWAVWEVYVDWQEESSFSAAE